MKKFLIIAASAFVGFVIGDAMTKTEAGATTGILICSGIAALFLFTNVKNTVENKIVASKTKDIQDEMIRTKELFDKEILTEEEYEKKMSDLKQKLL